MSCGELKLLWRTSCRSGRGTRRPRKMTSIQACLSSHPSTAPGPGRVAQVEHEYTDGWAWACVSVLDVHHADPVVRQLTPAGLAALLKRRQPQGRRSSLEGAFCKFFRHGV
jgi:hypothetical protein